MIPGLVTRVSAVLAGLLLAHVLLKSIEIVNFEGKLT
jgi:hypothetical protein